MRFLCESIFVLIDGRTLIVKNGGKKSFYHETKASKSFIPTSRMSFWKPITKRNEIIIRVHVCRHWCTKCNSKEIDGKKSFSYETNASMPFIPMKKMSLWCLIMNRRLLCVSMFILIDGRTLILKKIAKGNTFLKKPRLQFTYPNKENEFTVPVVKRK